MNELKTSCAFLAKPGFILYDNGGIIMESFTGRN